MTDQSLNSNSSNSNNCEVNRRQLRKRKINLNRLASAIACPQVCQFQHCGVQLADGDTLEVRILR